VEKSHLIMHRNISYRSNSGMNNDCRNITEYFVCRRIVLRVMIFVNNMFEKEKFQRG
jgi:hypothetical protein